MTKWSKALAVVSIGVAAGMLAPASANAATHHHAKGVKQVVIADTTDGTGAGLMQSKTVIWDV